MTTLLKVIVAFGHRALTVWVVVIEVVAMLGLVAVVAFELLFERRPSRPVPKPRAFAERIKEDSIVHAVMVVSPEGAALAVLCMRSEGAAKRLQALLMETCIWAASPTDAEKIRIIAVFGEE